jgi:hypothetical protein
MSTKASQQPSTKRKPKELQRPELLDKPSDKEITIKDLRTAKDYTLKEIDRLLVIYKKFITSNGNQELKSTSREEYNAIKKKLKSDINTIFNLSISMKKRRRNGNNTGNKGFLVPKYFKPELINFIKEEANSFGNYCYFDENEKPIETNEKIVSKLSLLMKENITATSLLTALFHIYIKRNEESMLVNDQKQFIKFTPAMKKYFSGYKDAMLDLIRKKKGTVQPNEINFDKFPTVRLQTLFSVLIDKDKTNSEKLKSANVIESLKREQDFVSSTNSYLKISAMAEKEKEKQDTQSSKAIEVSQESQSSGNEKRKERRNKSLKT